MKNKSSVKPMIDPSKLDELPDQLVVKTDTSIKSKKKDTSTKSKKKYTSTKSKKDPNRQYGPIAATPESWQKCGVKMNPETIKKVAALKAYSTDLPNRDIIVEKSLQVYFDSLKGFNEYYEKLKELEALKTKK